MRKATGRVFFSPSFQNPRQFGEDLTGKGLKARDNNFKVWEKSRSASSAIAATVAEMLAAVTVVHKTAATPPAIVSLDFQHVNSKLLRHLAVNPSDLHRIGWQTFEKLVGKVLEELGYQVWHTPLTRDGGVDLWALQRTDLGETLYAIDAKKYRPSRIVGPEPVRAIVGVTELENASVGMIVTTSTFSQEARRIAGQFRYRVSLKDFDGIVDWIRKVNG